MWRQQVLARFETRRIAHGFRTFEHSCLSILLVTRNHGSVDRVRSKMDAG
jgi:hypothetical protein